MQWRIRNGYLVTYNDYTIAATHNQYQMLKYLRTIGNIRQYSDYVITALLTRNPSIIPTIIDNGLTPGMYSLEKVIVISDLPMLQYLLKHTINISHVRLYQHAASNNCIHIIYRLKDNGYQFNQYMATDAIHHDHMHILQWYVDNGGVCNSSFVDIAIQSQNIDILRWLINRGVQWPDDAMSVAIRIGNVNIILYMLEFFSKLSMDLCKCISFSNYNSFQWCVVDQQWPVCGVVVNSIIKHGRPDMLQLLCDHGHRMPKDGCNIAASHSQLEMLKWLVERGQTCDASTFNVAVLNNQWGCENVVQYLIDIKCEIDYDEVYRLYLHHTMDADITILLQKYDII